MELVIGPDVGISYLTEKASSVSFYLLKLNTFHLIAISKMSSALMVCVRYCHHLMPTNVCLCQSWHEPS